MIQQINVVSQNEQKGWWLTAMLPDIFFSSPLFLFLDYFKISRGNRFFRRRVGTTISSAYKHLHLTKMKTLTMDINLGLVMNHDHSYRQSIEVRTMLLGISRKSSITYIRIHSVSWHVESVCGLWVGFFFLAWVFNTVEGMCLKQIYPSIFI